MPTTTLLAIRREMLSRVGGTALGRVETPSAFGAQTATFPSLATGGYSATKFLNLYLVRATAATAAGADRTRVITTVAPTTGILTHVGTAYVDQTVGTELVELLQHEPFLYDNVIQVSLQRLQRMDRVIMPWVQGQSEYWLNNFSWITGAGDISRICINRSPVITQDRYFSSWNTVDTSGNLQLDWWTLAGAAATYARSTTQVDYQGRQYSVAITRSGADATLSITPGLLLNGTPQANGEDLRGKQFSAVLRCWSAVATQVRVQWNDGTQTVSSSYHTGNSTWQELQATGTIATTATTLIVRVSVETSNTVCYASQCYGLETTVSDGVRRDAFENDEMEVPKDWGGQTGTAPVLRLDTKSRGGQYVIYSKRAYPTFDPVRVTTGTADSDLTDAPQVVLATMAIGRLFEGLKYNVGEDTSRYAALDRDWTRRGEKLALMHLAETEQPKGGVPLPRQQFAMPARRF